MSNHDKSSYLAENETPSVTILRHGHEQQAVAVIDNFVPRAERLVDDAAHREFTTIGPYYPGVRAPADPNYLTPARLLLEDILREVFSHKQGARLVECNYSLVTTAPERLQPIQRLPHFDTTEPGRIALLHYLCGPDMGGTAFYRHRATGYETVTAERFDTYRSTLHKEADHMGLPPARYFAGDTAQFEQIAIHEARFNRAIIYRGINLHSGFIPETLTYSANPKAGRLTVNTFLSCF